MTRKRDPAGKMAQPVGSGRDWAITEASSCVSGQALEQGSRLQARHHDLVVISHCWPMQRWPQWLPHGREQAHSAPIAAWANLP